MEAKVEARIQATGASEPASDLESATTVEQAFRTLKLAHGSSRREIKHAYRKLALEVHPDRKGCTDDGAAFRKLKAAYERLLLHTQFDEQLEELDADLEALAAEEERELQELEIRRFERELRENALADARKQRERRRAEDAQDARDIRRSEERAEHRRRQREEDEDRWLRKESERYHRFLTARGFPVTSLALHVHRTNIVRDEEESFGTPPAVMLLWPNQRTQLCVHRIGFRLMRRVDEWLSEDGTIVIEQRLGPWGQNLWMMVEQRRDNRGAWFCQHYWLRHSRYPFNVADKGRGTYTWAHWADAPAGRMAHLNSRAVRMDELRRIREKAALEKKKAEKAAADREVERKERDAEARLRAEGRREESEYERRKAERERLRKEREAEATRVEERKRHAAEQAEREQQMAQARELEYQDAEWQAFLRALAEERKRRLDELREGKAKHWADRVKDKWDEAEKAKEMKRKRQEKESYISEMAWEKSQAKAAARAAQRAPSRDEEPPQQASSHAGVAADAAANQDVDALGVSQLRSIVHAAGLSSSDCIEKADLRERAREALALLFPREEAAGGSGGGGVEPPEAVQPASVATGMESVVAEPERRARMRRIESSDEEDESDDDRGGNDDRSSTSPGAGSATEVCVKVEEEGNDEEEAQHVEEEDVKEEDVKAEEAAEAPTVRLDKGTRITVLWEDEEPPTWFEGHVHAWHEAKGHRIFYLDGDKRWENLEELQWQRLDASDAAPGAASNSAATKREDDVVVVTPAESQAGVRLTRSKRRCVKLAEEDVVGGLIRCPGCGKGIQMADGGCNVTTCYNTAEHGNRYFYFCAHCKAECPDGESICANCPMHNDRQTRKKVAARKNMELQAFLASNSLENPCEVD